MKARPLKSAIESLLRYRGLGLVALDRPPCGPERFVSKLARKGYSPGTIIDVGVADGTPWLYQFPSAGLVLVEPNPGFSASLERLHQEQGAEIHVCALGESPSHMQLNVNLAKPSSSSLLNVTANLSEFHERAGIERSIEPVTVEVRRLDDVIEDRHAPPFLLKIDTEGFELDVLRGARQTLERTTMLIAEVSVARRFQGSYRFSELVSFLDEMSFGLHEIVSITTFGTDGDCAYMDVAFVPNSSKN